MSGGSLNYFYCTLEEHIGDFGDKELDLLVEDLAKLFHDREWYLSSDTGRGDWEEARDAFKTKWFTEHGRQERIESLLAEFEEEVRRSFGISKKACENCMNWKNNDRHDGVYGNCTMHKGCLWHRREYCDDFKLKENDT